LDDYSGDLCMLGPFMEHAVFRYWVAAIVIGASTVCGLAQPHHDAPQSIPTRFCVVPVKDGAPTEADIGQTWRISSTTFRIPGLPAQVFAPTNRQGQWTIDGDRRLIPYTGPYPHSYLDQNKWVKEPWSDRLVAITWGGGVSMMQPGMDRFERLQGDEQWRGAGHFNSIQVLPRRKLTIVANGKGVPLIVDDNTLPPWLTPEQMAARNIRGVFRLFDVPSLSATLIADFDGWLHIVTDDDQWQRLSSISYNSFNRIFEDHYSGKVLFLGAKTVSAVTKNSNGSFSEERLLTTSANDADRRYHTTALLHQVLIFDSGGILDSHQRWRRLSPHGFEDIPGGDIGVANRLFRNGYTHELPSLGKVLIEGQDGLFLYNGSAFAPVADSAPRQIGDYPRIYDLASLKRVLVSTRNGLFEITADGRLIARPMPFPTEGLPQPALKDWPESGVALVSTREGLFTLDADLNASPVESGNLIGLGWLDAANGTNPGTGDMVLTGSRGLFLAVDGRRSPDVCARAREVANRISDSNICLRPVANTNVSDIGFAAGDMIEAPKGRGVLIETVRGLFLLAPDDKITPLQPREGQSTGSLAFLPWSGEVFAGGVVDTVIGPDLSITAIAKRRFSRFVGAFPSIQSILLQRDSSGGTVQLARRENGGYRLIDTQITRSGIGPIVDAPWFSAPIMANWRGLFSLDREGQLSAFVVEGTPSGLGFFSTLSGFGTRTFFAVARFRTIYVLRNGWHRITPERRWLPIDGLDDSVNVLAVLDPGSGEVLFATSAGVFAVNAEGQARRLTNEAAPRRSIRTLAAGVTPGFVLAGGDEGLFEISIKDMEIHAVPNGTDDTIGSVRRITSAPYAKLAIVEASNGTYALDKGSLYLIRELSAADTAGGVKAFDTARRVLAKASRQDGTLLFELSRRDAVGACASSL
jgi:hypothetical protein